MDKSRKLWTIQESTKPEDRLRSAAAGLATGALPAQAADVVSSNIVGYEKINLSAGYNMVGVQFVQVGGQDLALATVGKLDESLAGFDEDGNYKTLLEVWDGNGYDQYGWSGTSAGEYMEDESLNNMWLTISYQKPDTPSASGEGFWIKAEKAGTITISGEVPSEDKVTKNLVPGYNIVANPYPGSVKISEFGILDNSFEGFDEDGNFKTLMEVWDGNGYDQYGWSGTSAGEYMEDESLNNKWLTISYQEATQELPFGTAVWVNAANSGTIEFSSPSAQ